MPKRKGKNNESHVSEINQELNSKLNDKELDKKTEHRKLEKEENIRSETTRRVVKKSKTNPSPDKADSNPTIQNNDSLSCQEERMIIAPAFTNKTMPDEFSFAQNEKLSFSSFLKIVTWNIAGWSASMKKGFTKYIQAEDADVVCLQETKLNLDPENDEKLENGFDKSIYPYQYFSHSKDKKGYAGTMVASKIKPLSVQFGMNKEEFDNEGRLITLEFKNFYLINSYVPNASQNLVRLDYKLAYDDALGKFINELERKKPIIWAGDLNVAHQEIDLSRPKTNQKTPGFTPQERAKFTELLSLYKWKDVWRHFHPNTNGGYTYYSYRFDCRAKGIGWRLDYFICSESFIDQIEACEIRSEAYGASDHVPMVLMIKKQSE